MYRVPSCIPQQTSWASRRYKNLIQNKGFFFYAEYHFQIYSIFFFRLVQIDLRSDVLHAFFSRRQEKKVPFYNESFFVISPVRANPFPHFFTGSFAVEDHLRSRDHLRLGIICGTVQGNCFLHKGPERFDERRKTGEVLSVCVRIQDLAHHITHNTEINAN